MTIPVTTMDAELSFDLDLGNELEKIQPRIKAFLRRKVASIDVDDLFQDICLTAITSLESLKDPNRFGSWIYSIARSKVIDHYRSAARKKMTLVDEWDEVPDSREDFASAEELLSLGELRECIMGLTGAYKEATVMHFIEGLTARDISELLDVNLHTVKSYIHRGKAEVIRLLDAANKKPQITCDTQTARAVA